MAEQNTTAMAEKTDCGYVDEEGIPKTDAESEKKLDVFADEERSPNQPNVNAAECDDIVPSRPKAKRKREHPKKLNDNVDNTPDDSPVSDESIDRDIEISFEELLDKLHTPLSTQVCCQVSSTPDQSPPSVNHWSEPYNDNCVRKYFKMRRRVVGADDFIVHYLYEGEAQLQEIEMEQYATELEAILGLLEESTCRIDVTEAELFLPARCAPNQKFSAPDELDEHPSYRKFRRKFYDTVMNHHSDVLDSTRLDGVNFAKKCKKYSAMAVGLKVNLRRWMESVGEAVMLSPSAVDESTYEDVFKRYLEVFSLKLGGKSAKLRIQYRNTQVSSVPDIIFRRDERLSRYFGVVEVKKMTLDPTLKHAYEEAPKHGILSNSDDGEKPPKKRNVNFPSGATAASTREESDEEDEDQNALDLVGSPLTNSQRQFIKLFFGQLFGHVLALDCCYPHGISEPQQRLGIGVVGFRQMTHSCHKMKIRPTQYSKVYGGLHCGLGSVEMALVQYVIVRGDLLRALKWPTGALMAQACHACTAVVHMFYDDPNTKAYLQDLDRMHKVILEAPDEKCLHDLSETLTADKIDFKMWIEQPENYPTCIAVKPYLKEDVQKYFKKLKLFK